jgi:hypothetical protein
MKYLFENNNIDIQTHSCNSELKYETKLKNIPLARKVLEKAMDDLGSMNLNQDYYINFAKFEIRNKEF